MLTLLSAINQFDKVLHKARLLPIALLLALLIFVPVLPHMDRSGYDLARIGEVLLLPSLAVSLFLRQGPLHLPNRKSLWWGGVLIMLGTLSVLGAARPDIALRDWGLALGLFAGALLLSQDLRMAGVTRWMLVVVLAGQVVYGSLILLLLLLGLFVEGVIDYWHIFAGYENPRYFNHAQTLVIALLAGMAGWRELGKLWRWLAWYALTVHIFLLMLLLGRASCVALAVAALAAAFIFGRQGLAWGIRLLIGLAAGVIVYLLLAQGLPALLGIESVPAFRDIGERGSVEARLLLWRIALTDIAQHPWLGIGPMHFAHYFNGEAAHPHNIYLQLAAEYGLPFTGMLLVIVAVAFYRTVKKLRQRFRQIEDPIGIACFAACAAALVDGCFSGNFVMPISQLWIVLAFALLRSRLTSDNDVGALPETAGVGRAWLRNTAILVLLSVQIATAIAAYQEFQLASPNLIRGRTNPGEHLSPRFWLDGWF